MPNSNDSADRSTSELQADLFYPETEREPGDGNIQRWGLDIHPVVFPAALLIIGAFVAVTLVLGEQAASVYSGVRGFFEGNFGWFFLLSVNLFIVVLAYFALSKYGEITLGGVEAEKEFSDFSWMAMLFSAGMGIGLMFYSVAEPLYYFTNVPGFFDAEAGSGGAGIAAMTQTFFHWGFHPWAIYGLVGLGLAFFSFNRGLPLTFRSIFWPLLGERIYGWPGHLIDLVSVFATLFGLATSLGLGVAQINTGLSYILGESMLGILSVPNNTGMQIGLIAVITLIATASVAAGLEDGIRRLSTLNVFLMFVLLSFVLVAGATMSIFGAWVQGLGNYFSDFLSLAFFTGTLGGGASTVNGWTVFYWAWWIAWSPFVGMFVARISKGRTVREFVFGVFVLPSLFSTVWLSAFGGSALFNSLQGNGVVLATYGEAGQTVAMFALLEQFPFSAVSGLLAVTLVVTFFVTSSDSGSLVVDHLTSGGKHNVPRTQRIFWAVTEGVVASLLLYGGGLDALQTAAIATGFPFAIVLVVTCYTVYLGLDKEYELLQSEEFAERIENLGDEDIDIDVGRSRTSVVTNIREKSGTTDD
ncbi:BCCT family transporter [Haloferax sp. Atlit-4N]|uniref:Glycine betaine transporter n=1 Tax=Haloferax prahovense (strain DSM 18310 / JCM 13924 / TL6) TaxID=1227461 RepID=M0FTK3_HALPT|nr:MULTISPECIES: BCCT family transporter [Haloferax]ELZ63376.1 glycine betaine transporter [Haloferax prahovense DSM 18310]RDZ39768.1 BCCT family transporter [Haloferax sp. Atlit-19N]RDZ51258.1 BCCT family transporter [Haloferax sp. Atlit-4N]